VGDCCGTDACRAYLQHQQAYHVQHDQAVEHCSFYAYKCTGTGRRSVMPSHAQWNNASWGRCQSVGQSGATCSNTATHAVLTMTSADAAPAGAAHISRWPLRTPSRSASCSGCLSWRWPCRARPSCSTPTTIPAAGARAAALDAMMCSRKASLHPSRATSTSTFLSGARSTLLMLCSSLLSACPSHCVGCHA
jgi:hypothetical protein